MTNPEINLNRLSDLQDELRYLLNRWDPIGAYDEALDFPPDEYDCLIGPILTRLARRDSRASFSASLWNEIENHFGLDPLRCGTDAFADRLQAWYAARNAGSDVLRRHGSAAGSGSRLGRELRAVRQAVRREWRSSPQSWPWRGRPSKCYGSGLYRPRVR